MLPEGPEPLSTPAVEPARIVVDANVFARRDWMEPLLDAAEAGYITLFWSPAIIAEASKVLLWIWLQRRGGQITEAHKREAFDVARRWFDRMTIVFRVVEDCPPYAPQWTDSPQDANDRPVWTAAVNARADVVITANLKDGPPEDNDGIRTWNRTMYFHPDVFIDLLRQVEDSYETGIAPSSDESYPLAGSQTEDSEQLLDVSPAFLRFLRAVQLRAQVELPAAEQPE